MLTERQVLPTLRAWISSRHLINGRRTIQGPTGAALAQAVNHRERPMTTREFLDRLPDTNSPEEDAAMDEAEAQAVDNAHVCSAFAPLSALDIVIGMVRPA